MQDAEQNLVSGCSQSSQCRAALLGHSQGFRCLFSERYEMKDESLVERIKNMDEREGTVCSFFPQ